MGRWVRTRVGREGVDGVLGGWFGGRLLSSLVSSRRIGVVGGNVRMLGGEDG